ncbi:MAG: 3-oxoacyl-ACP synthase III [Planctomycetia bacterium]|nr:3-oxoacyl-ACP synthase III [Planctomycetia bacterium]
MPYRSVCLEAFGYTLPDEIVASEDIERRLAPLYRRLNLPEGRLELMTGIRERRFWPAGVLPSSLSVVSGEKAIAAAGIDRDQIGALIHFSVCRDYLEPATACSVHQRLRLPTTCQIFDLSNACLGFLNALWQAANMIELGQIRAALIVGSEGSRELVETTIQKLNSDTSLARSDMKLAMGSLTIGSASVAAVVVDKKLSRTGNRVLGGTARAFTSHWELCHSGRDETVAQGMQPLMQTDAERLLNEGIAAARESFPQFLADVGWSAGEIDKIVCHQVGRAHRKAMLEALDLDERLDFTTLEFLGNTGSAALPVTAALAIERGHIQPTDRVAFLGIGSGINVMMMGVQWQKMLSPSTGGWASPTVSAVDAAHA